LTVASHVDGALRITPRQRRVIELRLERLGRREIAHRLGISPATVREQLDRARAANKLVDEVDLLLAVDRERRQSVA
jgi:DNA-binding CsgD family transcriptional regulator